MDAHPVHHETEIISLPPLVIEDIPKEKWPIFYYYKPYEIPKIGALREHYFLSPGSSCLP